MQLPFGNGLEIKMSTVQIRMKDRVFARMLEIVLLENNVSSDVTADKDAKIPDGCSLVITDADCACRDVLRFERTFFIGTGGETLPEGVPFYKRPFLIDDFAADVKRALFSEEKNTEAAPTLTVDKKRGVAHYGKLSVSLTETETKLLVLLYENQGKAVTNEEIVRRVFDGKTVENSNAAAVYVNYLRKKLDERIGKRLIFSVRGVGYTLKPGKRPVAYGDGDV